MSLQTPSFPALDALIDDLKAPHGQSLLARACQWIEIALFALIVLTATTAPVALLQKLSGGSPPTWLGGIWALAACLCLLFAAMAPLRTLRAMLVAWPILLMTGWIWASLSWSDNRYETLRGAIYVTSSHIFACAVAARISWERLIQALASVLVACVFVSILLAVLVPSIGQMQEVHAGAWSGIWPEKQLFGIFACHGAIASLAMVKLRGGKSWWWLGVVICLIGVVGSTGRTAVIMTIASIGIGVWFWLLQQGRVISLLTTWFGMVIAISGTMLIAVGVEPLLRVLGRSSDLTGRTEVWQAVREIGDMKPLTGWGYQAIWRGKEDMTSPYQWVTQWTDFEPANAHHSFLDIYLQLGLVGAALLAVAMIWVWGAVLVRARKPGIEAPFSAATLMGITLICFTESNLVNILDLQWIIVPMLGAKLWMGESISITETPQTASGTFDGDAWTYNSEN